MTTLQVARTLPTIIQLALGAWAILFVAYLIGVAIVGEIPSAAPAFTVAGGF